MGVLAWVLQGSLGAAPAQMGNSSLWQQEEEGGLQEAAKTADCGHKPMGAETRVRADHTLEDVGLGGKGTVREQRQALKTPNTLL